MLIRWLPDFTDIHRRRCVFQSKYEAEHEECQANDPKGFGHAKQNECSDCWSHYQHQCPSATECIAQKATQKTPKRMTNIIYTCCAHRIDRRFRVQKIIEMKCELDRDTFSKYYLHNHDASAPVIRIVSFGFDVVAMPSNAGITSDVIPSTIVLFKTIKFFMNVTNTWKMDTVLWYDFSFHWSNIFQRTTWFSDHFCKTSPVAKAVEMYWLHCFLSS